MSAERDVGLREGLVARARDRQTREVLLGLQVAIHVLAEPDA